MKQTLIVLLFAHSFLGFGQVRLNEMQSSNTNTIADDFGEYDDWVEIHNPTTDSIEIGGLVLKDQLDTWAIPIGNASTHLPPGGYFLLWADDQEVQGIFHTNFKLASGGEFLGLYENDGTTVIDSISIPAMVENLSYMRCETGWMPTAIPSPLSQNDCSVGIGEINSVDDLINITMNDNGVLVIDIVDYSKGQYSLSLYSMDGKKVMDQELKEKKTAISHSELESGVYFAILATHTSSYSKRIWIGK